MKKETFPEKQNYFVRVVVMVIWHNDQRDKRNRAPFGLKPNISKKRSRHLLLVEIGLTTSLKLAHIGNIQVLDLCYKVYARYLHNISRPERGNGIERLTSRMPETFVDRRNNTEEEVIWDSFTTYYSIYIYIYIYIYDRNFK